MSKAGALKKTADLLIYSNLFIALAVACFTLQTALFFPAHRTSIHAFAVLNFMATFVLYNLQRLYYAAHDHPNGKYSWYNRNRRLVFTLVVLLLLSFAGRLFDFFSQHRDYLVLYGAFALLSLFYFLPPLRLRRYGLLKPFFIALVFLGTGVLLPLYQSISLRLLGYALGQFGFIAALCLLFDIKDLRHDMALGMRTFPQRFGIRSTRLTSAVLLLLPIAGVLPFSAESVMGCGITAVLGLLLSLFSGSKTSAYFYFLLVDGLIVLQYLLLDYLMA